MNLLAIETTGAMASAALLEYGNGERLVVQRSSETMNHLQYLIPMISELLTKCKKQIGDVNVIAISQGPGSFTGIRIGMATARMLAQVLDVPLVGVPTLKTFAYQEQPQGGLLCPVFDARRSQVYAGIYQRTKDGACRCLLEDGAYDLPDYLSGLQKAAAMAGEAQAAGTAEAAVTLFGDGIAPYGEQIAEAAQRMGIPLRSAPEDVRFQDAGCVARLGLELYQSGAGKSFSDIHPVYLRKAEAERKLEEAAAMKGGKAGQETSGAHGQAEKQGKSGARI